MKIKRLILAIALVVCLSVLLPAGSISNASQLAAPTVTPTPGIEGTGKRESPGDPSILPVVTNTINLARIPDIPSQDIQFIGTDGADRIYVATLKGYVYVLSPQGELLKTWRIESYLQDMAVDEAGNVFVLEGSYIVRYDSDGNRLLKFANPQYISFNDIAITSDGSVVSVARYTNPQTGKMANGVFFFDAEGRQVRLIESILEKESDVLDILSVDSIAVGPEGDLYVVESGMRQIVYHLDAEGNLISTFQPVGGPYSSCAVDELGRFYIGRYGKIHAVDANHQLIGVIDLGVGSSYAITVARNGTVLVALQRNAQMPNMEGEIVFLGQTSQQ